MTEEQVMSNQVDLFNDEYEAYLNIPYFLIEDEVGADKRAMYNKEFAEICKYYGIFKKGANFLTEGANNDYVPSTLRYKKAAMIVKKEARFMFSNPPTFNINPDDVDGDSKDRNSVIQNYLEKVLDKTKFNAKLMKAIKDCFIGKRIAIVVNFNNSRGISIEFLNSLEFIYEMKYDEIVKFVAFYNTVDTTNLEQQRWFKKSYVKENGRVYLTEQVFSGTGDLIETVVSKKQIKFDYIPATVVLNDGLTGDLKGESELGCLIDYEKYYSKLANADMDAERKSMNPIRYTVDASQKSTSKLPTSPGSYWDLQTDEDKPNDNISAKVGTLESHMTYSVPLKTTLDRIENEMYAELDVPNINSEQLAGVITSGKTIQALYWGLTVRCDEKMLAWSPSLEFVAQTIIDGAYLYPNCVGDYVDVSKLPDIPIKILVENNYPIPEDVKEEKEMDVVEVEAKTRSKKSYMKKWRNLSDEQADKELLQIKYETDLFENSMLGEMPEEEEPEDVPLEDASVGEM